MKYARLKATQAILERLLAGVFCCDYARAAETIVSDQSIFKSAVDRVAVPINLHPGGC
jgi:hypothetical protein